MSVPVDPPTFSLVYDVINDQTFRGDPVVDFDVYQGVKRIEVSADGPFYPEETGYFLKAIMGSEIFTAGSGVLTGTHIFHGLAQPSAATFFVTDDVISPSGGLTQKWLGLLASSFGLRFSAAEGILTYTSTWTGRDKPIGTSAATLPAYSTTLKPWLGWQADIVNTGGSGSTWQDDVLDFEMTINRAPSLLYTANNTQLAQRGDAGPIECTGRITVDFRTLSQLDDFENNQEVSSVITITRGTSGTSTIRTFTIEIPRMHFLDAPAEIQRGGVSIALQYSFRAVGSAAYKSPVKFTLINSQNTAYL